MEDFIITHNKRWRKFIIEKEGYKSKLKYKLKEKSIMEIYKTEVPVVHRGKGLAKKLAQAALEFAQQNGYKVKPTCSFMQKFIQTNPQYNSLVV